MAKYFTIPAVNELDNHSFPINHSLLLDSLFYSIVGFNIPLNTTQMWSSEGRGGG